MEELDLEIVQKQDSQTNELSHLIVSLLKGVIYQSEDQRRWTGLLKLQPRVRDYVSIMGLEFVLDEAEGYAFLRSQIQDEDSESTIPRLVARRPLSFHVSLLLALLRKRLAEFDAGGGDTRLVLSLDEIVELIRVFLPEGTNESRLIDKIETHINKIIDLGFLRRLKTSQKTESYEVQRILKAFVDAQWLAEFDVRLEQYKEKLQGMAEEQIDE
ncbi:MAG: DUF4194 domain-containing protein [Candidatus Melainabacteria bacterium]|nr:DUF4194 domain-containing protein [Candidatus Melainabacteria bacterium]